MNHLYNFKKYFESRSDNDEMVDYEILSLRLYYDKNDKEFRSIFKDDILFN